MKTFNLKGSSLVTLAFAFLLSSCMSDKFDDINTKLNFTNFDFKTTKQLKVSVSALNADNQPISGVYVEVYTQNPLNSDGSLKANSADYLLYKGITATDGKLNCQIAPATAVDSLSVLVNHIGLPAFHQFKITTSDLNIVIGGSSSASAPRKAMSVASEIVLPTPTLVSGYYVLGNWKTDGTPNYLINPDDKLNADFLADINASLPERIKLPVSHPEYLSTQDEGSIVLIEDAEVWVTFVHEGAGFLNTLGYYTHPNDLAPATAKDITDATIIFPNISLKGQGGNLSAGNKVQLLYLDPKTQKYSTVFPAGTSVAWFIISNGYSGNKIGNGYFKYYSDKRFNPEASADKKKHNVILKDEVRKLLVLGFEDLHREQNSDEDFNDAVFYSTVSPFTAVKSTDIKKIDTPTDTDRDGVSDSRDEYPDDAERAFNNYYPSKNNVGTLAFEDLWPNKGDYDFNDLVIDYNYNQITNAQNNIVEVNAALTVRAVGASLRNGFALQFNTEPNNVKSITGQQLPNAFFQLNANGTEKNQTKAVVPVFEDPYKVLKYTGSIVNTVVGGAYAEPQTINLKVVFNTPISLSSFGTPPYNPFIVINEERGKEVHLPGGEPTSLVDKSLFGTADDNTNLATQKYYMSDKYLPWAINIPTQFAYPAEKQDITKAYLVFNNWAKSQGFNYMDWYQDKSGYRDNSKIFIKK
ncbi:MAG: LruC domain-containing protein [Paludibacter sp.]|nr:LruC domain-containing protein [Paludibacter sp.]